MIQSYHWSTHFIQFTVTLVSSIFTSHILATDSYQSHCNCSKLCSLLCTDQFLSCHYSAKPTSGDSLNSLLQLPTLKLNSIIILVKVTLRMAVHRQSVHLAVKPLVTHDPRHFLFQLNPCGHSPYVTPSLTKRWVCLLWTCLAFGQVYISHTRQVIESSSIFLLPSFPNGLQAYCHFFFHEGCAFDVCDQSHLPPHGSVCMVFTLQLVPLLPP
jgi:hypothetical protein